MNSCCISFGNLCLFLDGVPHTPPPSWEIKNSCLGPRRKSGFRICHTFPSLSQNRAGAAAPWISAIASLFCLCGGPWEDPGHCLWLQPLLDSWERAAKADQGRLLSFATLKTLLRHFVWLLWGSGMWSDPWHPLVIKACKKAPPPCLIGSLNESFREEVCLWLTCPPSKLQAPTHSSVSAMGWGLRKWLELGSNNPLIAPFLMGPINSLRTAYHPGGKLQPETLSQARCC